MFLLNIVDEFGYNELHKFTIQNVPIKWQTQPKLVTYVSVFTIQNVPIKYQAMG